MLVTLWARLISMPSPPLSSPSVVASVISLPLLAGLSARLTPSVNPSCPLALTESIDSLDISARGERFSANSAGRSKSIPRVSPNSSSSRAKSKVRVWSPALYERGRPRMAFSLTASSCAVLKVAALLPNSSSACPVPTSSLSLASSCARVTSIHSPPSICTLKVASLPESGVPESS